MFDAKTVMCSLAILVFAMIAACGSDNGEYGGDPQEPGAQIARSGAVPTADPGRARHLTIIRDPNEVEEEQVQQVLAEALRDRHGEGTYDGAGSTIPGMESERAPDSRP